MAEKFTRRQDDTHISDMRLDIQILKDGHLELAEKLHDNQLAIEATAKVAECIRKNTDDIVAIFKGMKAGIQVLHWVSIGCIWFGKRVILPLAIGYAFLFAILHHGEPPSWLKDLTEFLR